MRARVQTHYLAAGLLTASTLLSFSCVQIIGADFDKPFAPTGTGGAGGDAVAVTAGAIASVTGAGGVGGGGGAGAGGCNLDPMATLTDTVDLDVWAKDATNPGTVGNAGSGALDFFTIRSDLPPPDDKDFKYVMTYRLYAAADPGNRVLLYQCVAEGHYITDTEVNDCNCIGYAAKVLVSSSADYAQLTKIVGYLPEVTAFIPEGGVGDVMCGIFGSSKNASPTGCTTADMLYGPK